MIAAAMIQQAYIDLYKQIRNYIWDYDTVVKLAELEVAAYMAFPDIDKVRYALDQLKMELNSSDVYAEDEDLQKAVDDFSETLDGADQVFYGLEVPQEIQYKDKSVVDIDETTIEEEDDYEDQEEPDSQFTDNDTEEA